MINVVELVTRKRIEKEMKDCNSRIVIRLVKVTNNVTITFIVLQYIFMVLQYIFIDNLKKILEVWCELKLLGTYNILNGPSKTQINLV